MAWVELHTAHSHGPVTHQVSGADLLELYSLGKAIIGEVKGQVKRMHGAGSRFWNQNKNKIGDIPKPEVYVGNNEV